MPGREPAWAPTLVTQFTPPPPPFGLVERPRLTERLERGLAEPVTLVCGPAGAGKTALLTSVLGPDGEHRVAWVSLELGDDDPARLWDSVLASLRLPPEDSSRPEPAALAAPGRHSPTP